jgi:hypothetical protein
MMNGQGKSYSPVKPKKFLNKVGQPMAEGMEGRGLVKGNSPQQNASRTTGGRRSGAIYIWSKRPILFEAADKTPEGPEGNTL